MSEDGSTTPPEDDTGRRSDALATRQRREAVREKAAQVQAKQRRVRTVRGILIALLSLIVLGVAAAAVAWAFIANANRPQLTPAGMTGDAVVIDRLDPSVLADVSGQAVEETPAAAEPAPEETPAAEPVDIAVYVDYLSEGAAEFQKSNARQLAEWVSQGAARLEVHPIATLTAKSNGTKYSLRAAAAAACVATHAPDSFFGFHDRLLSARPDVDTDGLSDEELVDVALAAGAEDTGALRACVVDQDFVSWAQQATGRALQEGQDADVEMAVTGPSVFVDGSPYKGAVGDKKEFAQFVLTIASDAYYSTPTPTPTP